ncbi:MAG: BamA/TamA family outer membrane protein [Rikenellaceae bacterium]
MRRSIYHILGVIITLWGVVSCGVTRQIPQGEYLLKSVKIEEDKSVPKSEIISMYELERYVRQGANKRLFGTNFYIWVYNSAKPNKDNWWNNIKRKVGEEPIYYSADLTQKSLENLKIYMDSQGFYSSTSNYEIDTTSHRKRAELTYKVNQGRPYIIDNIKYEFRDSMLRGLILRDTSKSLIHTGDVFSVALLDRERERVTSSLRQKGYYNFTVDNIEYLADTLQGNKMVDVTMIVKKFLVGYDDRGNPIMRDNTRFKLGAINILPNFDPTEIVTDSMFLSTVDTTLYKGLDIVHLSNKHPNIRPKVLRQAVPLYPDNTFNSKLVDQTYQNLMSIGYFKSARVTFREVTAEERAGIDSASLAATRFADSKAPVKTKRDTLDANINSPVSYLAGYILCTPALSQSFNVELEGSTTSSFYGLTTTVGYQNLNVFKGAENLSVDFTLGYENMKADDALKKIATEYGVSVGLSIPRFLIPFYGSRFPWTLKPRTNVEASVNFQDRPYYNRTLSSVSWSYSWMQNKYYSFAVRPIDVNLVKMNYIDADYYDQLENEYLKNSYQTQLISGLSLSYAYDNSGKNISGNSTMVRINAETAGNLLSGVVGLIGTEQTADGYYNFCGIRYAQYARADFSISRKIQLGQKTAIAGRFYAGAGVPYGNSDAVPFDRLFYAGGSNSMRGWTPRTLGPGSSELPEDMVYPTQLGDMKLETNLEFRFPIWEMIHGATFLDLGNVWYLQDKYSQYEPDSVFYINSFYEQLGFNTGIGLRLDIQFAVLRLDWGIQLHNPNSAVGERWIRKFDWNNTALNFGVGYPF